MEPNTMARIEELEKKIDKIYISVEKTRKYLLWTFILTIAFFVLPLIALMFVVPAFLQNYLGNITSITSQ